MSDGGETFLYILMCIGAGTGFSVMLLMLLHRLPIIDDTTPPLHLQSMIRITSSSSFKKDWDSIVKQLTKISLSLSGETSASLTKKYYKIAILTALASLILAFTHKKFIWSVLPMFLGLLGGILIENQCCKLLLSLITRSAYSLFDRENGVNDSIKFSIKCALIISILSISLTVLKLTLLIVVFNRHYLSETYTRDDYCHMYYFMMSFALSMGIYILLSCVYCATYEKTANLPGDLVAVLKHGLGRNDTRSAVAMSGIIGKILNGFCMSVLDSVLGCVVVSLVGLMVTASSPQLISEASSMYFPILIQSTAILAAIPVSLCVFLPFSLNSKSSIAIAVKIFIILYDLTIVIFMDYLTQYALIADFQYIFAGKVFEVTKSAVLKCIVGGVFLGPTLWLIIERHSHPKGEAIYSITSSAEVGEGTGIILGLSFGYLSCVSPYILVSVASVWAFGHAGIYGLWLLSAGCSLNAIPSLICQILMSNHSLTESFMSFFTLSESISEKISLINDSIESRQKLSKGINIATHALSAISVFFACAQNLNIESFDILQPAAFCGVIVGVMAPYFIVSLFLIRIVKASQENSQNAETQCMRIQKFVDYLPDYSVSYEICRKHADLGMFSMFFVGSVVVFVCTGLGLLGGIGCALGVIVCCIGIESFGVNSSLGWKECYNEINKKCSLDYDGRGVKTNAQYLTAVSVNAIGGVMMDVGKLSGILLMVIPVAFLVFMRNDWISPE